MTVRSAWLLNAATATPAQNRQDTRLAPLGTMAPAAADSLTSRGGLIPGPGTGPCNLTMSGMSATISIGRGVVQGTSAQGAYPVVVTAADTRTINDGHATLARVDTLWLIALDDLVDASGSTLARIEYTPGTPASSPVAPTAPATGSAYLRLWDIRVPAAASAGSVPNWTGLGLLTDRRTYTAAVGGIIPDGTAAGAYPAQYRDGGTTTGLERYTGSVWESRVYLGTAGQLVIGTDVNLRRDGANVLATDDGFRSTHASMASAFTESSVAATVNSTTYTDSGTVVSTTVVVPPSGRVLVMGQTQMYSNTSNAYLYSALEVVGSVSATIRAAADATSLRLINFNSGDNNIVPAHTSFRVISTNPGEILTIKWRHRVSGGGAQIDYRNITAIPLIA